MDKPKNNKFIPGIYNYCDRWCEHCPLSQRCLLYARDQKRIEEHRKKGEDPHDWKIVMQDVKKSFEETIQLIQQSAKERGIDLEKLPAEEYKPPDPTNHPLHKAAQRYLRMAQKFLKELRKSIRAEGIDLSKRIEVIPGAKEDVGTLREIVTCYEVISWYHTLISAKIYRALCQEKGERDRELAQAEQDDANGSAKVAYESLTRSIKALQRIYEWDEDLQASALNLLVEAERLRRGIDKEFPGHREFKRPGFDPANGEAGK